MKTDDTRDQAIDRLLSRSLRNDGEAAVTPECLDAETFAAWVEGTLDRSALAMAENHVAGCARCQSMAAVMIRTAPAIAEVLPWWRRSLRSAWLVPLTAGVAAVALWAVVPSRTTAPAQPTSVVSEQAQPPSEEAKPAAPPALADRLERRADAKDTASSGRQPASEGLRTVDEKLKAANAASAPTARDARQDASNERLQAKPTVTGTVAEPTASAAPPPPIPVSPLPAAAPAPAAAAAPARPAVAAESARAKETISALTKQESFAMREVASPAAAVRWRLGSGGAIDRTEDGGKTWTRLSTGVVAELLAGAALSPSVCWVVGRNGTILRTIDGRNWSRTSFPEAADLIAVEAVDASIAIVTTADGRRFRTANGGQSWTREPLQDF